MRIRCLAIIVAFVVGGCGTSTAPATSVPASPIPTTNVIVTTSAGAQPSVPAPADAPPSAVPSTTADGRIAFVRYDTVADRGSAFLIHPDGTGEVQIGTGDVGCSDIAPDRATLLCSAWFERTGARPATARLDGSGFRVLDAYPDKKMSLLCGQWSPDGARFLCASDWDRNANKSDFGLYTVRATDGGDLKRITTAPAGCVDNGQVPSPDWTRIVFERTCGADEHVTLFSVKSDGRGLVQLSSNDVSVSDPWGIGVDWSPDGTRVAFGAYDAAADSTAMFVIDADGTHPHRIVSTDTGTVSVQWSPDGRTIAFTSRYRSHPQVWSVHPDGTDLRKLTDGADGSISVAPVWSPDGSRLAYANDLDGVLDTDQPGRWSLWIMAADGTGRTRLTDTTGPGPRWLPLVPDR